MLGNELLFGLKSSKNRMVSVLSEWYPINRIGAIGSLEIGSSNVETWERILSLLVTQIRRRGESNVFTIICLRGGGGLGCPRLKATGPRGPSWRGSVPQPLVLDLSWGAGGTPSLVTGPYTARTGVRPARTEVPPKSGERMMLCSGWYHFLVYGVFAA